MGVDVHILIRHDFYELDNFEKSMQFAEQTIDKLKQGLSINPIPLPTKKWSNRYLSLGESCYYDEHNKWSNVEFDIPLLDMTMYLNRGYWEIWTGYHDCHITNKHNGRLYIADAAFDIARILGKEEAYYCSDFITEEFEGKTFEQLLVRAEKRWPIKEFPYTELMQYGDNEFPACDFLYHDDFTEQRKEYESKCNRYGEYKSVTISDVGKGFVRVANKGKVNLANRENGQIVFDEDFDDIRALVGGLFIGEKNGMVALFDGEAHALTEFVCGEFYWEREHTDWFDKFKRIFILNDEAQIRILATYYDDGGIAFLTLPYHSVLVKRKPIKCKVCKGKIIPIVYGEPSVETCEMAKQGEIALGGCCIYDGMPQWRCANCQTEFVKDI